MEQRISPHYNARMSEQKKSPSSVTRQLLFLIVAVMGFTQVFLFTVFPIGLATTALSDALTKEEWADDAFRRRAEEIFIETRWPKASALSVPFGVAMIVIGVWGAFTRMPEK